MIKKFNKKKYYYSDHWGQAHTHTQGKSNKKIMRK